MAKKSFQSLGRILCLWLTLFAPMRDMAWAQFSFPYDPDFEPQGKREQPSLPPEIKVSGPSEPQPVQAEPPPEPAGPTPQPDVAVVMAPSAGPFLLLDRQDPERILGSKDEAPTPEFDEFLLKLKPFAFDQARWNKMRSDDEQGRLPQEEVPQIETLPPEVFLSSDVPKLPPPELELPTYGTSLSVTGRKVVGFNYTEKSYLREQTSSARPKSTNLIDITQQLQLRMQGKVGPKITVNVDYDDTKTNKQDISVVYTGDPNEVVQNASFGDIDLSLPATEFVSYNKQLFGIRCDLKWKGFRGSFIGSRTKGTTKAKQFIGNTQFAQIDIQDTGYIRRQYYDLTFGNSARLPIVQGSERVYLAQQNAQAVNSNSLTLVVDDLAVAESTFTGTFNQLFPGQDYTIDYVKGILTFRFPMQQQYVVAVDFVDATNNHIITETTSTFTGGTGLFKLIKTAGDIPISLSTTTASQEVGYNRELKTVYSIGANQVVRDDGRGNFIMKVLDPHSRDEIGSKLNPVQKYPDTVQVDFENGLFRLLQPFGVSASTPTPDPDIYAPTPISKNLIHIEYRFRLRTFFLEPNLVIQSEMVLVDGVKLVRNVDYFIDYESGFITFFNENRIGTNSTVDISYEVAPFSGSTAESILGTRVSHEFNKHFSLGSTILYETGTKSPSLPTVGELAKSLFIYDVDSQIKDIWLLPFLKGTFQGEYARSFQNPNLNGKALIDNMEGIKQEASASVLASQWHISANPTSAAPDPQSQGVINVDIPTLTINPNAQAKTNETQKVLSLSYNFSVNNTTETSIAYVLSPTGVDMSQKSILEVTMLGDGSGNEINFSLGQIAEDADGTGGVSLSCADGRTLTNAPKTEDTNCDGLLQPTEDVGWTYSPVGKNSTSIGAGNGIIDSADLNQNSRLDPENPLSGDNYGYHAIDTARRQLFDVTSGSTRTKLDFTGWHTFQIPLGISTATTNQWTSVVDVRVSVRKTATGTATGTLQFARIAATGNSWLAGQPGDPRNNSGQKAGEQVTISAVNNVDNPNYLPIFNAPGDGVDVYNNLYGSVGQQQKQSNTKNLTEQALQMSWTDLSQGTTIYTKRLFPRALDVSQHHRFNFLLYGGADAVNFSASTSTVFFLRVGSDQNFFEIDIPLDFQGWRKFTLDQVDTTGSQIPNMWRLGQGTPGTVVFSTGAANLQQISQIVAGVYNADPSHNQKGALWLNEIYVSDPLERIGTAQKMQLDFDVPGWATFGAKYRYMDRNYQTPTTTVSNQDNRQDNAYLNFTRIPFFPMSFTLARTITVTPNTNATGTNSNLINLLQQGKLTNWNGTANGNFAYGALPRLSLGYIRARTEYELLTRLDDRNTYNGAMNYNVPFDSRFMPRTIDLTASYSKYSVSFDSREARLFPGNFNTDEYTKSMGLRTTFMPWTGASLNPNYSLTYVYEHRNNMTSGTEVLLRYPKSQNQTAGFSSNFRILRWLNPSANYSINSIENNILNVSTIIVSGTPHFYNIGDIKTVNRTANGSIGLPLNIVDIFPRTKLFRSFNLANSYQIQDGDVWNNVEKELDTKKALWVRTPLRPTGAAAQRANLTLRDTYSSTQRWSPLEAYNILGRKAAIKTLAVTNNYVKSIQRTETTGTPSKTISVTLPDLVASLGQLERLTFTDRWVSNGQLNLKYAAHETETVSVSRNLDDNLGMDLRAMIIKRLDTTLSFNLRNTSQRDLIRDVITQRTYHEDATLQTTFDIRKFRFTPKVDYTKDTAEQGNGVETQNLVVVTPSLLSRADIALPRGLKLPFSKTPLLFTNRIIWTSSLSMALRSSPVTVADNSKLMTFNTSGDYEIAKNLRMTLNGAFSRLWHNFLKEEEYLSYQFGTTLTFQF